LCSDSQAAIKAFDNYQINSKLVWNYHQSLEKLGKHNRVQMIWVPEHEGIQDNETVDQMAKLGAESLLIGSESACGISAETAKKAVRNWTIRGNRRYWESLIGKGILQGPSVRRTKEMLKQKPVALGDRAAQRTLSPERTPLQNGTDG
jgi:hypothetical protein